MKDNVLLLLLLSIFIASSHASVVKLTTENFAELTDGKTVFIKYFAPWCGHCQAMADDWEKLGTEWEGHEVGLVGEVDCTDPISEDLCETIEGFPTLRFGDSDDLEEYEGGRSLEELFSFAKETLSTKMCSIKNIDICSDEKKTEIAKYQAMSSDELKGIIETEEAKIATSEANVEAEVMKLTQLYEELVEAHQTVVKEVQAGGLKLMKAVAKSQGDNDGKDEL